MYDAPSPAGETTLPTVHGDGVGHDLVFARCHALLATAGRAAVRPFCNPGTVSWAYVVHCPVTRRAAVIDPVLDDRAFMADAICDHVRRGGLTVDWLLETHIQADHRTAADLLRRRLGGMVAMGAPASAVPSLRGADDAATGFDRVFRDGAEFRVGDVSGLVLHAPGHTPDAVAYLIGDALFVGDTMFMPDVGTGRTDFPGGGARALFRSTRRLLALPDAVRLFVGHDYPPRGRADHACETTVAAQRNGNIHVGARMTEREFIILRHRRDAALPSPQGMAQAVAFNRHAGRPQD